MRASPTPVASPAHAAVWGMELYILSRAFGSNSPRWLRRCPRPVQDLLTDLGFAHFLVVVVDKSSGSLCQFDFGPSGGRDVLFGQGKTITAGEVRERQVSCKTQRCLTVDQRSVSSKHRRADMKGHCSSRCCLSAPCAWAAAVGTWQSCVPSTQHSSSPTSSTKTTAGTALSA